MSDEHKYEYTNVNVTLEPPYERHNTTRPATIESVANDWATRGWRVACVMPARGPGYADCILFEREVRKTP